MENRRVTPWSEHGKKNPKHGIMFLLSTVFLGAIGLSQVARGSGISFQVRTPKPNAANRGPPGTVHRPQFVLVRILFWKIMFSARAGAAQEHLHPEVLVLSSPRLFHQDVRR